MESDALFENGLPADLEAEKTILGAPLLNDKLISEIDSLLEIGDFFLNSHQRILESEFNLSRQGMAIDLITLTADLQARGIFEQTGGATYIASLIDGVPRTDTIEPYARIVKRKARERQAISIFNQAMAQLADGEEELETILGSVSEEISR